MDSEALSDLLTALPEWSSRLQGLGTSKFPSDNGPLLGAVNPAGEGSAPPPRKTDDETIAATKKMNQKPGSTKAKFSSITGPDIYYDGESQQCLFDCWTALNAKRGALRKEMMAIRRKKVMTLPSANYGYSDSDDELEADESGSEKEDTEADRLRKEEEERQRIEEEKKKREEEKRGKLLEYVDSCLDKAARACENAAYLWLKGEGCMGHVVFITQRLMEAVQRVSEELQPPPPPPQELDDPIGNELKVEDEGFGEDTEDFDEQANHHASSEEELPHKPYYRRTSRGPVEVAG